MNYKLLLGALFLTISGISNASEPTEVFKITTQTGTLRLSNAVNSDGTSVPLVVEKKGDDAVYTIYTPDFKIDKTFTIKNGYDSSHSPSYTSIAYKLSAYEPDDTYAVQNLCGNNGKWFVIISSYTWDSEEEYYKFSGDTVYDETGTAIYSVPTGIETGLYYYRTPENKIYPIVYEVVDESYERYTYTVLDFDGTGAAPKVIASSSSKAYPNPLPKGRSMTIDFSDTLTNDAILTVTDINGATVFTRIVKAGATSTTEPSDRLRHGNYIFSVISDGNVIEKGKIIAK